ncbi:MAG: SPOR domain-containing protein [Bacteroidetes bacterium]|nr:SPOR domain-containing protein [Rhodothermia bacterium]MCS7154216.1 SPOR domain-containing protein [Bacteroidota bacterium]MCX7906748.1 SPOR domain-containing protein [Bacteroidota bacterium]MDW8136972.1 SPOR domain-containing protein [Bacteroidota bacterium]MDW8285157.1 SPOR domain-containing protein [Bacteroidota bacterium]
MHGPALSRCTGLHLAAAFCVGLAGCAAPRPVGKPQEAESVRLRALETFDPTPYRESWDSLRAGPVSHDLPAELEDVNRPGRAPVRRAPSGTPRPEPPPAPARTVRPVYRDGYRIQIFSSANRFEAEQKRIEALQQLPYPVYVVFQAPYYRVHVGDFLSRSAAQRALSEVRTRYPSAWIVPDRVRLP